MITSSHIIYGWAAARATKTVADPTRTLSFVVGSFLPDIPVYLFFIAHGLLLGTNQSTMWNELYFDSAWTPFFTLSHSLLLWPLLFLVGTYLKQRVLKYIAGAGILHITLDLLVHNDDAYRHFWPLSDWKFVSPISYWDPSHYGRLVSVFDTMIIVGLLVWLGTKYTSVRARVLMGLVGTLYVVSQALPFLIF